MTRRLAALRVLTLAGMGAAGLIAAHALDYLIVVPDGVHRGEILRETGHGYMPKAVLIAIAAGVIAGLAGLVLGSSRNGRTQASVRTTATRLAAVQIFGFIGLEVVERLLEGEGFGTMFGPLLAIGVLLQLVVAGLGACVVWLLHRAGRLIRLLIERARTVTSAEPLFAPRDARLDSRSIVLQPLPRGPPRLSAGSAPSLSTAHRAGGLRCENYSASRRWSP